LAAGRFLVVADEQLAAGHDRVIPRLSFDGLEPAEFLVPVGAPGGHFVPHVFRPEMREAASWRRSKAGRVADNSDAADLIGAGRTWPVR
jgi:hypothetical protein